MAQFQVAATQQAIQNAQIERALGATARAMTLAAGTSTPSVTMTPAARAEPDFALSTPQGEPLSEWEGIPIMAAALAGEAQDSRYTFTIRASPAEIQGFYDDELARQGWQPFATTQGSSGPATLLYTRDSATLTVAIIRLEGDTVEVVLGK